MAIAVINRKVKKRGGGGSFLQNFKELDLNIKYPGKISSKEISFFTNQLSLMVEIGTPLNVSLSSIARQLKNPAFKQVITGVITDVEEGKLLSVALAKYPHIFSNIYISLVKAGENSGQLKEMLDRIVKLRERQEKFMDTLKKALTYPSILCFVSVAVVIFLLAYIFPKFAVLFTEIEDILPATTKFLLFLSSFMRSYWYFPAILLGISGCALYIFMKSNTGKITIHRLKIRLPILSNIYIRIYLVQMMRTLGFLMGSNIPLMEALMIARSGAHNLVFAKFIDKITENVEEGKGLSLAFTESAFIPENARQIIRTGEETQNLSKVMLRLSDYYEGEINDRMKTLTTIIEPALLIIMGAVVGLIVISLIMPIFKLSRAMH